MNAFLGPKRAETTVTSKTYVFPAGPLLDLATLYAIWLTGFIAASSMALNYLPNTSLSVIRPPADVQSKIKVYGNSRKLMVTIYIYMLLLVTRHSSIHAKTKNWQVRTYYRGSKISKCFRNSSQPGVRYTFSMSIHASE